MKKLFFTAAFFLINANFLCAQNDDCRNDCESNWSMSLDLGGGYRQDNLRWNTLSPYAPATKIREKWDKISIGLFEVNAAILFQENYLVLADFDYGWVGGGDHPFKNTEVESGRVIQDLCSKTKGNVWDISGGVGYQLNFFCNSLSLAPVVGYSYHQQRFRHHHYKDRLFDRTVFVHSRYDYQWKGPWFGFASGYQMNCDWQFYFDYRFHWAKYSAHVNEDLGIIFQHQKINSVNGNEFILGANYIFCDCLWTGLKFDYKNFSSHKRGRFTSLNARAKVSHLRWESYAITWDVGYSF